MSHSRLQLEPTDTLSVQPGRDGTVEIVVLNEWCDCSAVIELTPKQLAALCEQASEQ